VSRSFWCRGQLDQLQNVCTSWVVCDTRNCFYDARKLKLSADCVKCRISGVWQQCHSRANPRVTCTPTSTGQRSVTTPSPGNNDVIWFTQKTAVSIYSIHSYSFIKQFVRMKTAIKKQKYIKVNEELKIWNSIGLKLHEWYGRGLCVTRQLLHIDFSDS
jgi:hypothetical protein